DLRGGGGAIEVLGEEALERVPPDRAPDREADEALDARRRLKPLLDLRGRGSATQQHASDARTAGAGAGLLGEHLGVGTLVDALDLPDVDLAAEVLGVLDRSAHQLGPELGVIAVGVAADLRQLRVGRRDEQLEQELAVVLVQPIGEPLEPYEL